MGIKKVKKNVPNLFFVIFATMKTVYRTKVSVKLVLLVTILGFVCPAILSFLHNDWKTFFVLFPIFLLILAITICYRYEVTDTQLIVRQVIFFKTVIDISNIKSIESTHTLISAPAASLDRLRITYNKYDDIVISPKNKEGFIKHLQSINPQIKTVNL